MCFCNGQHNNTMFFFFSWLIEGHASSVFFQDLGYKIWHCFSQMDLRIKTGSPVNLTSLVSAFSHGFRQRRRKKGLFALAVSLALTRYNPKKNILPLFILTHCVCEHFLGRHCRLESDVSLPKLVRGWGCSVCQFFFDKQRVAKKNVCDDDVERTFVARWQSCLDWLHPGRDILAQIFRAWHPLPSKKKKKTVCILSFYFLQVNKKMLCVGEKGTWNLCGSCVTRSFTYYT